MTPVTLTAENAVIGTELEKQFFAQIKDCLYNDQPMRIDPALSESLQNEFVYLIFKAAGLLERGPLGDENYYFLLKRKTVDGAITYYSSRTAKMDFYSYDFE